FTPRRPPTPTPFPSTTLFRSPAGRAPLRRLEAHAGTGRPGASGRGVVGEGCLRPRLLPRLPGRGGVGVALPGREGWGLLPAWVVDRKSTRLNSSHVKISYAVF